MRSRPRVLQAYPMLHSAGEDLLRQSVELVTASEPTAACLVREGQGAVALIARRPVRIGAEVFDALPDLMVLSATGSGADCFDVAAATARGLPVLHNPGVAPEPVAEYILATAIALLKRLPAADRFLRAGGDWDPKDRFRGRECSGRVMGLVGFGHIHRDVARRARLGFDMDVLAFSPSLTGERAAAHHARRAASLAEVLRAGDIVSVSVPYDATTRNLIGSAELALMRPGAVLVNTARGGVVDEEALVAALRTGALGGAAVDVFDPEPPPLDHPLFGLSNVIVTPHIAGLTDEAMRRLSEAIARNVLMALRGERPPHLVDPSAWPPRQRVTVS